jgi:hypothetical protein
MLKRLGLYINTSLRNLITIGQGQPNQKEGLAPIGGVSDRN